MLHVAMFWGGSRSTKPCVFPCKVAVQATMKVCVADGCGCGRSGRDCVPSMCFATSGCFLWCSSMRFLKLWLQIAL